LLDAGPDSRILKELIDIVSNIVVIVAAIIGGLWALRRYQIERTEESALDIGVEYNSVELGSEYIVTLDVVLTNKGKTRLQAKTDRAVGVFSSCLLVNISQR
jgi:hypothetical protein